MKTENFERAKAIEAEIKELVDYKNAAESDRSNDFYLYIQGKINGISAYKEKKYGPQYNSCPHFLKEQLQDDLNFIADRIVAKINRRIAELEKEFETL